MRGRLARYSLAAVLAAGIGAGSYLAATAGSGAAALPGARLVDAGAGRLAATRATLVRQLRAQSLHFTGVWCVANGRSYQHQPIVRCNVDFGDPHIEAYCTVIEGGRLLTNHQYPAIPCRHDGAGAAIITYPPGLGTS